MFNILHGVKHRFLTLKQPHHNSGGNALNTAINPLKPIKPGQVVKFHTPYPNEDPNQRYGILEIHLDVERPRAKIKELNGNTGWASITTVMVEELEVVPVNTYDMLGHEATVNKADYSQATGKVVKVHEQQIVLDLTKGIKGVETNVWLTVQDKAGNRHVGTLFVN